jgi:glycosyltransferase involved in cell wall biosynthesis
VSIESVAVIIPVFNAGATIAETLWSVRQQTYTALEIVVVDDGSSDDGPAIIERHARQDPRIRLVRQANAGVATARNRGIAETSSRFIAPVDADDLWRPDKIARQMEVIQSDERIGLVYCWFSLIDEQSRVFYNDRRSDAEGDVLEAMIGRNVVGNGSSALMRREAIQSAGGYDPSLRARKAQGCEDYKLYYGIAQRYRFGLVRDLLVGYRELPNNMSGDFKQMLRSRDICAIEFADQNSRPLRVFGRSRARVVRFMLSRAIRARNYHAALQLFPELFRADVVAGFLELISLSKAALRRKRIPARVAPHFLDRAYSSSLIVSDGSKSQ